MVLDLELADEWQQTLRSEQQFHVDFGRLVVLRHRNGSVTVRRGHPQPELVLHSRLWASKGQKRHAGFVIENGLVTLRSSESPESLHTDQPRAKPKHIQQASCHGERTHHFHSLFDDRNSHHRALFVCDQQRGPQLVFDVRHANIARLAAREPFVLHLEHLRTRSFAVNTCWGRCGRRHTHGDGHARGP